MHADLAVRAAFEVTLLRDLRDNLDFFCDRSWNRNAPACHTAKPVRTHVACESE